MGEDFGQWVSLEGNVIDWFLHPDQLSLLLQEGPHHFVVNISLSEPIATPPNWLGSRVEVHGVCWTEDGGDGVPTDFRIHTPGTNTVTILRNGPPSLFASPLYNIRSLITEPDARDRRVRVSGTATLLLPDQSLFVRDETGSIQARLLRPISRTPYFLSVNAETLMKNIHSDLSWTNYTRPRPWIVPITPGDRVEVVGTPTVSGQELILCDAEYRSLGAGVEPVPLEISAEQLIYGHHEGDLVKCRGRLVDRETHQTTNAVQDLLLIRDGNTTLQVLFGSEASHALPSLPPNALLQVTGVCSSETGEWKATRVIRLLLRNSRDVTILAQPPPWDSWDMGRLLLIGSVLGVSALAWIGFLRHRVTRRTAELALSNRQLVREIEERKRAQAELSRALAAEKELSQLKSRFVSMVSHEFRTPLGVILASADLLSDYLDTLSPEERAEQIADIKQSTRHMAALMEDVLLLGRVESGRMGYHPQSFDLLDFCRRLTDEMMSATSHRCPIELTETEIDTPARGDEALLRHIFHNLLANGVKYSSPGQPVHFGVERDGNEAVFTVRDNGIGICSEDQKHVFEAFFRGKNVGERPGSGLGLVVVKRCVELHGGVIHLESALLKGTTVVVRVPLLRAVGQTELVNRAPAYSVPQPL
jgi:signal transduction histidine kinase